MTDNADPIIRDLEIMANTVNYREWIHDNIRAFMGQRIIEVGAGIGNFTQLFTDRELAVALDNSEAAVGQMREKFSAFPNVVPLKMDIEGDEFLGLKRYEADTIVCINVLEHILADTQALANMNAILTSGGRLLLFVPAFQCLFGSIDRIVGHYRRYGKEELATKVRGAGFTIKDLYYMNMIAAPGWFVNNRILKRQEESPAQVLFFDRFIVPWLRVIEGKVRPPFGLSLVAICEKE